MNNEDTERDKLRGELQTGSGSHHSGPESGRCGGKESSGGLCEKHTHQLSSDGPSLDHRVPSGLGSVPSGPALETLTTQWESHLPPECQTAPTQQLSQLPPLQPFQ